MMLKHLGLILILTIFLSCLLTPPIFSLILSLWPDFRYPFSRVYDRVLLAVLLFCLYIFRKKVQSGEVLAAFSGGNRNENIRLLFLGAALSFSFSLLASFSLLDAGLLRWRDFTSTEIFYRLLKSVPAALVISLLEEGLFRVLLLGALMKRLGLMPAVIFSSLIYAVVHFISPDKSFEYPGYSLTIGFEYLWAVLDRLLQPGVLSGVVGLFLIGVTLCLAYIRSRSIYLPVGLHAGWVLISKLFSKIYLFEPLGGIPGGLGSRYFLVAQPNAWASIVLVAGFVFLISRRSQEDV